MAQCGFDDGEFLLAGSLKPQLGGGISAHHISHKDLRARVDDDSFVGRDVGTPEIIEFEPTLRQPSLEQLFGA